MPTQLLTKREVYERIEAEYPGYHPVVALVRLAYETKSEAMRFACHSEVAKYVEPKLAAVAHTHSFKEGTGVLIIPSHAGEDEWAQAAQVASEQAQRQAMLIEGEANLVE